MHPIFKYCIYNQINGTLTFINYFKRFCLLFPDETYVYCTRLNQHHLAIYILYTAHIYRNNSTLWQVNCSAQRFVHNCLSLNWMYGKHFSVKKWMNTNWTKGCQYKWHPGVNYSHIKTNNKWLSYERFFMLQDCHSKVGNASLSQSFNNILPHLCTSYRSNLCLQLRQRLSQDVC